MRADQVRGGSNDPMVSSETFSMQTEGRMRYDAPARMLSRYVTGYAIYASVDREPRSHWFLPAPAMIVVLLDAGPVDVEFRNRSIVDVPKTGVWGPTAHAYRVTTRGGVSVGIGLTAEGWSKLVSRSAGPWREQVRPLSAVRGFDMTFRLWSSLDVLRDDAAVAPVLDGVLPSLFHGPEIVDADLLRRLDATLLRGDNASIEGIAADLGMSTDGLRRFSIRHHGMPVKSLLSRVRFIRCLSRWISAGRPSNYSGIEDCYHDVSHFLRDATKFLGTTPLRFDERDTTFLRASLRARAAVMGAAAHALHDCADP